MSTSEGACVQSPKNVALPPSLYQWAAPEVIKQRPCTKEADIYSLCALIQELYTGASLLNMSGNEVLKVNEGVLIILITVINGLWFGFNSRGIKG